MAIGFYTLDKHVIHINLHISFDLVLEDFVDQTLIGGPSILQPKRYHFVAIKPSFSNQDYIFLVFSAIQIWLYPEKVSIKLSNSCLEVASTS